MVCFTRIYVGLSLPTGGFLHNRGITEFHLYLFASDLSGESSVITHGRRRAVAKWIGVYSESRANAAEDPKFSFLGGLTSCMYGRGSV